MTSLEAVFAPDGSLAGVRGGLEPRPGQLAMAQAVERGLRAPHHVVVEAGTGVGKSYGYLVPALRSGKRVVISTGTIALQERLLEEDLPQVARALGVEPRFALLKGRSHYLCREKFRRQSSGALLAPSRSLDALWDWAAGTQTGDRAELPFVPASHEWETLDADADDCVGELCAEFKACHYFRARAAARDAQIVVVNHALFFLDLARGGLLPPYDVAILDEAHQCEHWATAALTGTVSERSVGRALRRLRDAYDLPAEHVSLAELAVRGLQGLAAGAGSDREALRREADDARGAPVRRRLEELRSALRRVEEWLVYHAAAEVAADDEEARRRLELHLRALREPLATIDLALSPDDEAVAWLDRAAGGVSTAPYDVAPFLRERLFERVGSVVLASATIAQGGSFAHLRRTLGIDAAQELVVASPFDYGRQARLYVAPAALNPKSPRFADQAADLIAATLSATDGRAFVLFTSHARMRQARDGLRDRLPFPTRMQGDAPQGALLRWFRETPRAVLLATGSFWEGVDVVGGALSCVIVDRLPFPSPGEPLVAARLAALEAQGLDAFEAYMVPSAVARLKQGFGRLIRSSTDRGACVLLDGRAGSTRFGAEILAALPPARRVADLAELAAFFREAPRAAAYEGRS